MSLSVSSECHQPKDFISPTILMVQTFHWSKDFIGVFLNLSECLSQCLLSVISRKISLVQRLCCLSNVFLSVFLNVFLSLNVFLCVFVSFIIPKISLVQRLYWCLSKSFGMSFSVSSECHQPKDFIGSSISLVQR